MAEPTPQATGPSPRDLRREASAHRGRWLRPIADAAPPRFIADAARLVLVHLRPATLRAIWRRSRAGTWRAAVAEESMVPALLPGDWLLVDPTTRRWPRRGAIVIVREPDSVALAVKRVAARPGDHVRIPEGFLHLAADEAWLLGDNAERSVDSRRYGPVSLDRLVGRVWLRYGPIRRVGVVARRRAPWPRSR